MYGRKKEMIERPAEAYKAISDLMARYQEQHSQVVREDFFDDMRIEMDADFSFDQEGIELFRQFCGLYLSKDAEEQRFLANIKVTEKLNESQRLHLIHIVQTVLNEKDINFHLRKARPEQGEAENAEKMRDYCQTLLANLKSLESNEDFYSERVIRAVAFAEEEQANTLVGKPVETTKKFLTEFFKTIQPFYPRPEIDKLDPLFTKRKFIPPFEQELEAYLRMRTASAKGDPNHYERTFLGIGVGFKFSEKEAAVNKLLSLLDGKDVYFTSTDLLALRNGRLGQIVRKYEKLNAVPLSMIDQEKRFDLLEFNRKAPISIRP